jgi:hypothetical protein
MARFAPPRFSARSAGRTLGLAALCLALTACASFDRHTYYSSVDLPRTVRVVESFTSEPIWEMGVPAHYTLVLDLDRAGEIEIMRVSGKPATSMNWSLKGPQHNRKGTIPLPGTPVYIEQTFRPAPEFPPTDE